MGGFNLGEVSMRGRISIGVFGSGCCPLVGVLVALALGFAAAGADKTIFDDDWAPPPPRAQAPKPLVPGPATAPEGRNAPADPPSAVSEQRPVAIIPKAAGSRAIPAAAE